MKFGLILCTYGRSWDVVHNFISSLRRNSYRQWELIIIDQNESDEIERGLFDAFERDISDGKIKYFRVNFKGLSVSRNFGLTKLSQDVDIIAFPDDDCEYPENLLSNVVDKFRKYDYIDFLTGVSYDKEKKILSTGRWSNKSGFINLYNVWISGTSITIFIRKKSVENLNTITFDEKLGVGSKTEFGSGEDKDLLIRLTKRKTIGYFFLDLRVYHPNERVNDIERTISYAKGMGAVFRKNFMFDINYIRSFIELMVIRPFGGALLSLFKLKFPLVKIYFLTLVNRWSGFLKWQ